MKCKVCKHVNIVGLLLKFNMTPMYSMTTGNAMAAKTFYCNGWHLCFVVCRQNTLVHFWMYSFENTDDFPRGTYTVEILAADNSKQIVSLLEQIFPYVDCLTNSSYTPFQKLSLANMPILGVRHHGWSAAYDTAGFASLSEDTFEMLSNNIIALKANILIEKEPYCSKPSVHYILH